MQKPANQIEAGFSETFYGVVKRLNFVNTQIARQVSASGTDLTALDIGCGTGNLLTIPLARRFASLKITGYDQDEKSIAELELSAGRLGLPNLRGVISQAQVEGAYDIVIASEVIEHVEAPVEFLEWVSSLLRPGGLLILTLPNGYGWFEADSTVYRILEYLGVMQLLRKAKGPQDEEAVSGGTDTLALSLHVNFFSYNQIRDILGAFGFRTLQIEGRTFLCGDITSRILAPLTRNGHFDINNWLGGWLPKPLVSGWMFAATAGEPDLARVQQLKRGKPNLYARFKRWLNLAVTNKLLQAKASHAL